MEMKKTCNTISIILLVIGLFFQLFAYGYWWTGLITVVLILLATSLMSGQKARFVCAILSFITSTISLAKMIWMLVDFTKTAPGRIYHPIVFIVFDLIIIACGVLLILMSNAQKNGKEYNPIVNKLTDMDNR